MDQFNIQIDDQCDEVGQCQQRKDNMELENIWGIDEQTLGQGYGDSKQELQARYFIGNKTNEKARGERCIPNNFQ